MNLSSQRTPVLDYPHGIKYFLYTLWEYLMYKIVSVALCLLTEAAFSLSPSH